MKKLITLSMSLILLLSGCGKTSPIITSLPSAVPPTINNISPTQSASPIPSPTFTLIPTLLPVTPAVSATIDPLSMHFSEIPEQITLQDVSFNPLVVYEYLLLRKASLENMTWKAVSSEHINANISDGILSATPLDASWFGSETIQIEACESKQACAIQEISYSVMDKAVFRDVFVNYVGNSGFLITVGDKKILIDCMFEEFPEYELPIAVQSLLLNAEPPFDNVDLVIATHDHADHFSAEMVRQHMQNNPNTVFISTTQAASQLADFGDRIIAMDPIEGTPVHTDTNGIQVEAIYLSHGTPPSGQMEIYNNAYVVTINGIKVFHTGDIDGLQGIRQYNLENQNIDMAFIPHFYLQTTASRSILQESVGAKYIFPIHYHYTTPQYDADVVRFNFPEAIVFDMELERWIMPRIDG
jgi:L-ascorbate metabolism protein UlaG (beta-lactamase superfamily)